MPNFLEDKLTEQATKKGLKGPNAARYIYGALNNIGAMRGNKITTRGKEMQRKHDKLIGLASMWSAA
jgi:hypothetical protein